MDESIFKAYDIRGIYGKDINEKVARNVALISMKLFPPGAVIIAHDGRHGSEEMAAVIMSEYAKKVAYRVVAIGLSTTPMFYFVVNDEKATGGIMVTASHNPKEYNGFKTVRAHAEPISGIEMKKYIHEIA